MKRASLATLLIAPLLVLPIGVSASEKSLPSDQYEQPKYRVLERVGAIEIREYSPMLLAEVEVTGDRSSAANEGFQVLARYIFGGNVSKRSISMTSPVTQVDAMPSEKIAMTSPVTQVAQPVGASPVENMQADARRWTIAFMMPSSFSLETLPKPKSDRIRFRVTTPEKRVAIRFSGFSTEANLQKHREALEEFVSTRKLTPLGVPMMAFYDDPFTLPWKRRNEWWVAVAN